VLGCEREGLPQELPLTRVMWQKHTLSFPAGKLFPLGCIVISIARCGLFRRLSASDMVKLRTQWSLAEQALKESFEYQG